VRDGYARFVLTVIAAALLALLALELGWLPHPRAEAADAAAQRGRWQFAELRYGALGTFLARFDTATGRLERVRFPAGDVVWEEVGTVARGQTPVADPLRPPVAGQLPSGVGIQGKGIVLGPGALLPGAPPPTAPPAAAPGAPAAP
jgi:hypothetical protein